MSISYNQCKMLLQFYKSIKEFCDLDIDAVTLFDQIKRTTHQMTLRMEEDTALDAPSEKFNDLFTGILYDFMGFLTTRPEQLVLSSHDNAAPAVPAIADFLIKKGVKQTDPNWSWPELCNRDAEKIHSDKRKVPETRTTPKRGKAPGRQDLCRNGTEPLPCC